MTAVGRPDNGQDERPWRVGEHYDLHVYAGDTPVATFHRPEDAARAVAAVNGARPGAGEQQREQVARWLHQYTTGESDWDTLPRPSSVRRRFLDLSNTLLLLLAHTDEETR